MAELAQNQNTYDYPNDSEVSDLGEEEQNAAELAADQELYAAQMEASALRSQGQEFHHPSYFKYLVLLFPLVFISDGIDILAHLTGVGIPFGSLISGAITVMIILIFWFTDTKQKRANEYVENVEKRINLIAERMANAEKNIVRVARLSRRVPGAKQIYRKVHLATIRRTRLALKGAARSAKNPILRYAISGVLNLVPLLAILPWQLIGVYLSYRAEKESYKNAREASESVFEEIGETAVT